MCLFCYQRAFSDRSSNWIRRVISGSAIMGKVRSKGHRSVSRPRHIKKGTHICMDTSLGQPNLTHVWTQPMSIFCWRSITSESLMMSLRVTDDVRRARIAVMLTHIFVSKYNYLNYITVHQKHFHRRSRWGLTRCRTALTHHFFNFWHSGTLALRTERQRARMSKIKTHGLDQYGTGRWTLWTAAVWNSWRWRVNLSR